MHAQRVPHAREGPLWQLPLFVFAILALANVAATLMVWRYSGGDRGWWPVHLGFFLAVSFSYALLFSRLVRGAALARARNAALYTLVLAIALNVHALLFYSADIDWLAVNTRKVQLTFAQRVIQSDLTPLGIYVVFLIGAMLVSGGTRNRSMGKRNA